MARIGTQARRDKNDGLRGSGGSGFVIVIVVVIVVMEALLLNFLYDRTLARKKAACGRAA
jgi:hypothetical protein